MPYRDAIHISTDSHVTEPIEIYGERVDAEYRDRVPRIETIGDWRTLLIEGLGPRKLMPASEREVAIVGDFDAEDRFRDQMRDGVSAEVIFPTFALQACYAPDDAEFQRQLCRAYNSWAIDVFDDHRLLPVGMVPMLDIDGAIEDAKRSRSRASGRCSSPRRCRQRMYNDGAYDPFWAVAQDLGLPLTFHSGTGHEPRVVRGPGRRGRQLPDGRAARRPDGDPHHGGRRRARPLPGAAGRHRGDRRVVARRGS